MSVLVTGRKQTSVVPIFKEGFGLADTASGPSVTFLRATSHPNGNRIDLSWVNPVGVTHVKILRKQQAFPYDLDDLSTVIYDRLAVAEFKDLGVLGAGYYYYLVAASIDEGVTFGIESSARVFQLAIDPNLKSADWLWANGHLPREAKVEDLKNNNILRKMVNVIGAGMDLFRSRINAITLLNDPANSPLHMVMHQTKSLGFEPEIGFDYNVSRRVLTSILSIYKDKGDGPGLIEFIRLFTGWDARYVEFGEGSEARVFQTWDGIGSRMENSGSTISSGDGFLIDSAQSWAVNQWQNGELEDAMGNFIPVASNTPTMLIFAPPTVDGLIPLATLAGAITVTLATSVGWVPGLRIQIRDATGVNEDRRIISVNHVTSVVTFDHPLINAYLANATLSRTSRKPDMMYLGNAVSVSGNTLTDTAAVFSVNQWVGYNLIQSDGIIHPVVSNDHNSITIDIPPIVDIYKIAYSFI